MDSIFKTTARAEQVASHLRDRVLSGAQAGAQLDSVRVLAGQLGVSVPTVRAAQAVLARQGLIEVRHGRGAYVVAQPSLPHWIGLYTAHDILAPRSSAFYTLILRELRQFLNSQGLRAEVYLGDVQPEETEEGPSNLRFRDDVQMGRLNGLVIVNAPDTAGWINWVENLHIPVVGWLTPYRVSSAHKAMVRPAVHRLHEQGCRRIAMMSWSNAELQQQLREALAEVGLDYHPGWVRSDLHPMHSGAGWEEFREIWTQTREKPDGLVVTDDVLFDDVQIAIQEMGICVPEQLRIVTYANKGVDKRYPFPVTVALSDPVRHAEMLGSMLLKRLRGEPVMPVTEFVPLEFSETAQVAETVSSQLVPHAVLD